jgi:hypothetical protein
MKASIFAILLILALIPGAFADGNITNQTPEPVIFSLQGGHAFGENPIQIIDRSNGNITFIGNTSSRNIQLSPDHDYWLRVEPAGLSDAANSPDSGLVGMMDFAGQNPIGLIFFALIASIAIARLRRK